MIVFTIVISILIAYFVYMPDSTNGDIFNDSDDIIIKVISEKETNKGIKFTLSLTNDSDRVLIHNVVYLSYMIQHENSTAVGQNEFKVETRGNKLHIEPKESVTLTALMSKEVYINNERIRQDTPFLEIIGYFDELDYVNGFMRGGDLGAFDENYDN